MGDLEVSKPEIILIPWDPESPEHVERLYQQRIACGWNQGLVESWRDRQREGKKSIQWIVLSESDAAKDVKIAQHLAKWPLEASPISDTALTFGGKPRTPPIDVRFNPIGHISLDCDDPTSDTYDISTFYVSSAIQGGGIGRAAMDVVETMATSEPLCAKTLKLYTSANENYVDANDEKWAALGREFPTFSKQDWYQRRGYEVYDVKKEMWSEIDSQGKKWWSAAVFMKKDIR